jgi:hypothetical protein
MYTVYHLRTYKLPNNAVYVATARSYRRMAGIKAETCSSKYNKYKTEQ